MSYARIAGTGHCLPRNIVTNDDLAKRVDTNNEWIVARTGIRQRHLASDDETTCSLATQAAQKALAAANCSANDLDLIIVATTTPDRIYPSTACLLQAQLGNHGAAAFDVQAVCSGFVYALSVANQMIRGDMAKRALVVGAEVYSRILNWEDRTTCVLFGDGAGAVVLEASDEAGILSCHLHADGSYSDTLTTPGTVQQGQIVDGSGFTQMNGKEVFKFAVNALSEAATEALQANQMYVDDVDWLIPHQANTRIIESTAKKLQLPMEKVIVTVPLHGNTSAASVPLALDVAVQDGRIQRGQHLLLNAIGGGFTWGAVLLRF